MRSFSVLCILPLLCLAVPVELDGLQFHSIEARQENLPLLKLPYGTWQASKYDAVNDIYTFKNIRFAAPPVGNLRFAKPAPPTKNDTLQTGDYGGTCVQSIPKSLLGGGLGGLLGNFDIGKAMGGGSSSEDCLFLDLYVPGKALKGNAKLPIINWNYGGAYILGSKDGIYDGTGLIKNSGGNVIFVAGNYRLGAYGFLAGTTVEKEGTPNAGFWDQRAVQQWIQDHATLFGGDANEVSLWGESAGAGSAMHHLTAFGGKKQALFKRAVLLSPAFDALIDRKGDLEKNTQGLLSIAGCAGKGLACMRALSSAEMKAAQDKFMGTLLPGKFGFGPAADGDFVRQIPQLELASGNFVKGIESVVVSHVADEASMFVRDYIRNDSEWQNLQTFNFGVSVDKFPTINEAMIKQFPSPTTAQKYKTQRLRTVDFVQFSVFTCNVRFITEAFKEKAYNIQFSRGSGWHGTDILAAFFDTGSRIASLATLTDKEFASFAGQYQSYMTSHARTGDPNRFRAAGTPEWPHVEIGPTLSKVMNAADTGFSLIEDTKTKAEDCDFWKDTFATLTAASGYSPPGGVVPSTRFGVEMKNPSANFS